eukprot:SAG31_NODE_6285_length_2084_cov_3.501259_2_plen_66_part_00
MPIARIADMAPFDWGNIDEFGKAADVLATAGSPVDLVYFDFASYYIEYPRANTEWWFCEEMVDRD